MRVLGKKKESGAFIYRLVGWFGFSRDGGQRSPDKASREYIAARSTSSDYSRLLQSSSLFKSNTT
jgi:hypothetical protein